MAGYSVLVRGFLDTTSFGKGDVAVFLEDVQNLCWTEYLNDVGEAFFTISQEDDKIQALRSLIDIGAHVEIRRDGALVWAGWLGEVDETYEDAIIYAYSYVSGLYVMLSDWGQEWSAENVSTIFTDLWTRATDNVTLNRSRLAWMTQGTVQDPVTTSGGAVALTLPFYKIYTKRILQAFKELAAYSISDTTNRVVFEVTPAGVFNLWKNRGTTRDDIRWRMGEGGNIRSYRRIRMPVDRRTVINSVGTSPNDVDLRYNVANGSLRDTIGRMEEPMFLQWVRDQSELERVVKLRLQRAGRVDTDLMVTFNQNSLIPYRATNAEYDLGDQIDIRLNRGLSANTSDPKIIVGQQIVYRRMSEMVRLLLADRL